MDLYLNPDGIQGLCEVLSADHRDAVDVFKEAGVDGIFLGDDWGTQTGPLIKPDQWRTVFKPWYVGCAGPYTSRDSTCSSIAADISALIEDFIEIGVDVLNPLQPNALDIDWVADQYGGKICFFGGIDTQRTLTEGTPAR